jgi:hypothetical protein
MSTSSTLAKLPPTRPRYLLILLRSIQPFAHLSSFSLFPSLSRFLCLLSQSNPNLVVGALHRNCEQQRQEPPHHRARWNHASPLRHCYGLSHLHVPAPADTPPLDLCSHFLNAAPHSHLSLSGLALVTMPVSPAGAHLPPPFPANLMMISSVPLRYPIR